MLEFFVEYWLEALFGVVTLGISFLAKKFYKLYKAEQKHQKSKEQEEFQQELKNTILEVSRESRKGDARLQQQIDVMTSGILSIQGKNFRQECRDLLNEEHEITLDEFEAIQQEYDTYKALGGNSNGDTLFDMVKKKATYNIALE